MRDPAQIKFKLSVACGLHPAFPGGPKLEHAGGSAAAWSAKGLFTVDLG
jgi:hypothetical protein